MIKIKYFIIYLLTIILHLFIAPFVIVLCGFYLDRALKLSFPSISPVNQIIAFFLIIVGFFWEGWALYSLVFIGKGHPQEVFGKPILPQTVNLIIRGPFRFTRNPMVFGLLNIILAWALLFESLSAIIIVFPVAVVFGFLYIRIFEERELYRRFGREYLEYRKKVPILVPRLSSSRKKQF
ncbi:MAG: isoprenylcysteine carboxylmethyltransferase family protein [Firmicutes bacterium]|nr:isoprenylcysteine carboxylmethyltransferase family protein [Bacillota bacterium]